LDDVLHVTHHLERAAHASLQEGVVRPDFGSEPMDLVDVGWRRDEKKGI
jgi:hypothetical protein